MTIILFEDCAFFIRKINNEAAAPAVNILAPVYVGFNVNQDRNTISMKVTTIKAYQLIFCSINIFTITNVNEILMQNIRNIEYPE